MATRRLTGAALAADAAYRAGFRGQDLVRMVAIAGRESRWDPTAQNLNAGTGDHSIGLWQINQLAHHGRFGSDQQLKDPYRNARAAYTLFKQAGLQPWSTRNSYQPEIPEARRAVAQITGRGGASYGPEPTTSGESVTTASDPAARQQLLLGYLSQRGAPDALLGLAAGLRQLDSAAPAYGGDSTAPQARQSNAPAPRTGGKAGLERSSKPGKIIGVPHQGTHTLGNWQSDNAIDVAMPIGTILTVPRDAVVEKVRGSYQGGASRFDGYQVTLRLADGNRVFYTHLSRANVKPGQRLRAGQAVGRSGAANGVQHLHFGVERGDPRRYF